MLRGMESQLSLDARRQLDRFCGQYLQLQLDPDYPDAENLRNDAFQQSLYARLFDENVIKHAPPQRYQLRILKELTKRIEQSIQDWEEEVCHLLPTSARKSSLKSSTAFSCLFLTCCCLSGHI
jgi:hypothetical protein